MIHHIKTFYNLIGPKLLILLLIMQIAAVLEGFGVSLMLPIIQGGGAADSQLESFINWAFEIAGIPSSLGSILIVLIMFFLIRAAPWIPPEQHLAADGANLVRS